MRQKLLPSLSETVCTFVRPVAVEGFATLGIYDSNCNCHLYAVCHTLNKKRFFCFLFFFKLIIRTSTSSRVFERSCWTMWMSESYFSFSRVRHCLCGARQPPWAIVSWRTQWWSQPKYYTSLTVEKLNIKTEKTSWTCVAMRLILECLRSGISSQHLMEMDRVMGWELQLTR